MEKNPYKMVDETYLVHFTFSHVDNLARGTMSAMHWDAFTGSEGYHKGGVRLG